MALAGTLKDFSLADIFQLIGLQKKTGVLTLTNDKEEARILFMNGLVVGADTNNQKLENRLGHVLVKSNRISQNELEEALTSQRNTLQRLGQVLVQKGFIKQEDLRDSLQMQTSEIIYRLFRWLDGEYHFKQERFVDYDQENFAPITSESILMEGVRMLDEWPMIEKVIPDFETMVDRTREGRTIKLNVDQSLSVDVSGEDSFNSLLEGVLSENTMDEDSTPPTSGMPNLSHQMELVLRLIDGPSMVQDLIDTSGLNEFETCRALYDLIGMGLVQKLSDEEAQSTVGVIEKEHHIPVWVPAILVVIIAAFSFYLAWNPLNTYFPSPAKVEQLENQWDATVAYRLRKIASAVEIYYITVGTLPPNLGSLERRSFLREDDIKDPRGNDFFYDLEQSGYTLAGRNFDGTRSADILITRTFAQETASLEP
ncbi:MAG: DUF4388 domain-containing protein [Acidobacteriota bacterium]|nr:DUF4388 domain-containing protein [Acidobacteriota bacterium]